MMAYLYAIIRVQLCWMLAIPRQQ